jgi:hypothetical protein
MKVMLAMKTHGQVASHIDPQGHVVPDNDRYEGSSLLLFDEQNHPVDSTKLTHEQQKAYCWRRCYKLVTLLHTNRAGEFFLYGGLRLTVGKDHEAPVLYELVDEFVQGHGRGVMPGGAEGPRAERAANPVPGTGPQ